MSNLPPITTIGELRVAISMLQVDKWLKDSLMDFVDNAYTMGRNDGIRYTLDTLRKNR